ncbi:hypothetical protein MD484_g2477, partial [Candolleomyces efflorescens]
MALSLFALKSLHSRASTVEDQVCANLSAIEVVQSSSGVKYVFTTNYRSTAGIVTSCLSTILLCTWFTVHPNICGRRPTQWQVLRAKITLFAWALIMPEVVMMHACNQWFGAREIAKKMGSSRSFWLTMEQFEILFFSKNTGGPSSRVISSRWEDSYSITKVSTNTLT